MLESLLPLIQRNWHKPRACVLLNLVSLGALAAFFYQYDLLYILRISESVTSEKITLIELVIILISSPVVTLFWWLSSSVPRNGKGKVGIIIAISTEGEAEKRRLKNDFIRGFREKITKENKQDVFFIMEYPEHYATQVNRTTVEKFLNKSKAHFMVYGLLKKRHHEGIEKYFFELEFAVRHAPVPIDISQRFAKDMGDVTPRRVNFDAVCEFRGFSVTTDWAVLATEYVIGVAAAITGDLIFAVNLLRRLYAELLKISSSDFPAVKTLREKTRSAFLASWYELQKIKYYNYRKKGDIAVLGEIFADLKEMLIIDQLDPQCNTLLAIVLFLKDRDVDEAFRRLEIMKKPDNSWRYSEAFLYAYRGELSKAVRSYRKAFRGNSQLHVPEESEEFIHDIIKIEPDKYQLWFCLGYINYGCKNDFGLAKEDFKRFLEFGNDDEFGEQRRLSKLYVYEIERKLFKSETVNKP